METPDKILIVDNNDEDAYLAKRALRNFEAKFHFAGTLDEGRRQSKEFGPQMVFLDVKIPTTSTGPDVIDFDGILAYIRDHEELACIILITGHVDQSHLSQAIAAGACAYIDKRLVERRLDFEEVVRGAWNLHRAKVRHDPAFPILRELAILKDSGRITQGIMARLEKTVREDNNARNEKRITLARKEALIAGVEKERRRRRLQHAAFLGVLSGTAWAWVHGGMEAVQAIRAFIAGFTRKG